MSQRSKHDPMSVTLVRVGTASLLVLASVVAIAAPVASVPRAILYVCESGCPYTTIKAALADAEDGDTVQIGPGTYAGGLHIRRDITLIGSGPERTTIEAGGTPEHPWVIVVDRGVSATVQAVAIDGGLYSFDINTRGTLTLTEVVCTLVSITNYGTGTATLDHVTVDHYGSVFNHAGGTLTLVDSSLNGRVDNFGSTRIEGSAITDILGPVAAINNFGTMQIDGSTIEGNGEWEGDGTGGVSNSGELIMRGSIVRGNIGSSVGGIVNGGTMTLLDVTVGQNIGGYWAGGIDNTETGIATLRNSTVIGNVGQLAGGIFNEGSLTLIQSTATDNRPNNCVGCG
jgi:hypothetical protein